MIEDKIKKLFNKCKLGSVIFPIESVSGGFLHRMYKVNTEKQAFAVKHLNSNIMKRPEAMENYLRAEGLEAKLEAAGIPIVPALIFDGRKMQEISGEYFYIFKWQPGSITDWDNISIKQCWQAGNIQGRIHAIEPKITEYIEPELSSIDWKGYLSESKNSNQEVFLLLKENEELLIYAENEMNKARINLPSIECITDEDMDPKNVMWQDENPFVIDLECLDFGNPVSHVLQLSLQWSGITTCNLDLDKQKAFFDGYLEAYDNGFRDYDKVFGVAYTWVEWLEYNISRALGHCQDKKEQEMGLSEVKNTINRIRYIYEMEKRIKHNLRFVKHE